MSAHASQRLGVVDGLKGVAILLVIVCHIYPPSSFREHFRFVYGLPFNPYTILTNSYQAVGLFFVLSGFVLAWPYVRGSRSMESVADMKHFYLRRSQRLLPLYAVSSLIGLIFWVRPETLSHFAYEVFRLATASHIFTPEFLPPANYVMWSLQIEIVFSLVFPLLIWLHRKIHIDRILAIGMFVAAACRYYGMSMHPGDQFFDVTFYHDNFFARFDDFLWGMWLAVLVASSTQVKRPLLRGCCALGIIGVSFLLGDGLKAGQLPLSFGALLNIPFNAGVVLLTHTLIVGRSTILSALLSLHVLQFVGRLCFSLYIWHYFILYAFYPAQDVQHLLMFLGALLPISLLSYSYIEGGKLSGFAPAIRTLWTSVTEGFRSLVSARQSSVQQVFAVE